MHTRFVLAAAAASTLALAAAPALAQSYENPQVVTIAVGPRYNPGYVNTPMRVNVAPPSQMPVEYARPPAPTSTATWIPGSWTWNGAGYAWTTGQWATPQYQGAQWIAARWERHEGYYLYYPGYWSQPVAQPEFSNTGGTQISLGSTVSGAFQNGLPTTSAGALYNDYAMNLYAGQTVTLVLRGGMSWTTAGGQLDPLLQVYGAGQLLAQDDDGAGGMDSRVVFTAQWTGTFVIRATTYGVGMNQGYYSLATRAGNVWM